MADKRFQVFVSSTFRDLHKERQAVTGIIQEMGHIPAGMELFPSDDASAWEVIERVIDRSDYYVLVIGGMYGARSVEEWSIVHIPNLNNKIHSVDPT